MPDDQAEPDPTLHRPATAGLLRELFWAGLLPRNDLESALGRLGIDRRWAWWSNVVLLLLGGALVLAGAIFFVAYNWMGIDRMVKLAGLEVLTLACVGGAWYRGLGQLTGQALLFAACVLVGVFLAAFGQVYQTGADAWELFRAWALLIVLWAVASRNPAHWLLLLAVADAAVILYLDQVRFHRWAEESWAWLLLAALQCAALCGLEIGNARGYFLRPRDWPRWILVPAVLFFLCAPATKIIVEDEYHRIDSWLIAGGLVGAIAGGYPYLRHRARDLFGLTCIGFAVAWIITVLASRTLNVFKSGNCGGLVIVGLLVVGMLTVLVRWIRRLNDELQPEAQQPDALLPETPPPAAHPPAARPPAARPPETRDE